MCRDYYYPKEFNKEFLKYSLKILLEKKTEKRQLFLALKLAKKEDLVLVAGKGHEKFQTIKNKKIPFSDREVITEFFAKNGK